MKCSSISSSIQNPNAFFCFCDQSASKLHFLIAGMQKQTRALRQRLSRTKTQVWPQQFHIILDYKPTQNRFLTFIRLQWNSEGPGDGVSFRLFFFTLHLSCLWWISALTFFLMLNLMLISIGSWSIYLCCEVVFTVSSVDHPEWPQLCFFGKTLVFSNGSGERYQHPNSRSGWNWIQIWVVFAFCIGAPLTGDWEPICCCYIK